MKSLRRGVWLLVLLSASTSASAQYQCRSGNTYYQSSRPCVAAAPAEPATSFGQLASPPAHAGSRSQIAYQPRVAPASDHLRYMSGRCVEIAEAIRTGPSRGVRYDTIGELQREYRAKCGEEDSEARQQASEQQRTEREQRGAARRAERNERDRVAQQSEQCHESLRILHAKRQRIATMNEGEKADLARFEDAYQARCRS
jgi:hypothetical protein